jgi:SOS response regulatory protein OraA/RecX
LDQIPTHLSKSEGVYVLDNEPRNAQIVRYNERLIELGKNVCIWPNDVKQKDINDLITSGYNSSSIKSIIDDNTVSGLQANLRLTHWRKV